jgi:hypothetical protein
LVLARVHGYSPPMMMQNKHGLRFTFPFAARRFVGKIRDSSSAA